MVRAKAEAIIGVGAILLGLIHFYNVYKLQNLRIPFQYSIPMGSMAGGQLIPIVDSIHYSDTYLSHLSGGFELFKFCATKTKLKKLPHLLTRKRGCLSLTSLRPS